MSKKLSESGRNTSNNDVISLQFNQLIDSDVSYHKIDLNDLLSCTLPAELIQRLNAPIIFSRRWLCYTFQCLRKSFAPIYGIEDPVANEWSYNTIYLFKNSRRDNILTGLTYSIQLADKLMLEKRRLLSQDEQQFVIMLFYSADVIDSVKVTFYLLREGIPDIINPLKINDSGEERYVLITV